MNNRLLYTAVALLAAAPIAKAATPTDWYILEGQKVVCTRATELAKHYGVSFKSPYALEDFLRQIGKHQRTKVYRDEAGAITVASVSQTDGLTIMFFSTSDYCETARSIGIANGTLTNPGDLK